MRNQGLLLTLLLALPLSAAASTATAEKKLQTAMDHVLAIADRASDTTRLAGELEPVLPKYVSFDAMTRRSVGPGWRQFTPAERKQATELFTKLVIRSYSSRFTPGEKAMVTYRAASEPAPGRAEITTDMAYKGNDYVVLYRLEASEGWRITDIVVEGVSIIANYRTQFDAQFRKGGAQAVIDSLVRSLENPK